MGKQMCKHVNDAMLSLALWYCVQKEMKALKKANKSVSGSCGFKETCSLYLE